MPVPWLDDDSLPLPAAEQALGGGHELAGLVAASPGLSLARLEQAYRGGLFPWYSQGQPVLWWSPDPRMVLEPSAFKVSRSFGKVLRRFLRQPGHRIRFDADTPAVIDACARAPRPGQSGTWIVPAMARAYADWHRAGAVHSVETWIGDRRVGGLYGVRLGQAFFGESMFAEQPEASKIALAALVVWSRAAGIDFIDCQQVTSHLASLGARPIGRAAFLERVRRATRLPEAREWAYDESTWATLWGVEPNVEDTGS